MTIRNQIILSFFFLAPWCLFAKNNGDENIQKMKNFLSVNKNKNTKSILKVVCVSNSPYAFKKEGGDIYNFSSGHKTIFMGSDIEILDKILENSNYSPQYEFVTENQLVPKILSGQADLVLGVMKNKKWENISYFLKTPIRTFHYVFFTRVDDMLMQTMTYENAKEQNKIISIFSYKRYPEEFWKHFPYQNKILNDHIVEVKKAENAFQKLTDKKVDLSLLEKEIGRSKIKKMNLEDKLDHYKNILFFQDYYVGISKKSDLYTKKDDIKKIEKNLSQLENQNKTIEILEEWVNK